MIEHLLRDYPPLRVPFPSAPRLLSRREAEADFTEVMAVRMDRIRDLRLRTESIAIPPGRAAIPEDVLRVEIFLEEHIARCGGEFRFTGTAGIDAGLLVGTSLMGETRAPLVWALQRFVKRHAAFNTPVLTLAQGRGEGFPQFWDPIGVAISSAELAPDRRLGRQRISTWYVGMVRLLSNVYGVA